MDRALARLDRLSERDSALAAARAQALTEAIGLAAELEQMTALGEAVEQGGNQTSVVIEDTGPVRELQVGGDFERTARVAMGEQDEQQLSLVGAQLDKLGRCWPWPDAA